MEATANKAKKTVAILDDDAAVLRVYTTLLEDHEFDVAPFVEENALDQYLTANDVQGFVIDVSFPGASDGGLHYCHRLRTRYPLATDHRVIWHNRLSGYRISVSNGGRCVCTKRPVGLSSHTGRSVAKALEASTRDYSNYSRARAY